MATSVPAALSAPYSQEAEEAVLGSILVNPSAFIGLAAFLNAEDFFLLRHSHIWRSLLRLHERNEPVDTLTVAQELKNMAVFDEVGGHAYLMQLVNNTPTSVHAEIYGRLVERTSIRRRMLETADKIRELALDEEKNIEVILNEAETETMAFLNRRSEDGIIPWYRAVSDYYSRLERLLMNPQSGLGIPSGFRDLDQMLGGFRKKNLILFAGIPGSGKSAFLGGVAMNAARVGARVGFFTLEMTAEELTGRFLAMESGINSQKLTTGLLTRQEQARAVEIMGRVEGLPIYLDESVPVSPMQLQSKIRRLQYEYGLDLVIVDYLQLMDGSAAGRKAQEHEKLSHISNSLKTMAKNLDLPVLCAAQLNRELYNRRDKRPVLGDLYGSGSLEKDADVVMFLYRDEMFNEATEFPNQADIIISKHRNGPTGTVSLYYDKALTKFMDAGVHRILEEL